MSSEKALHLIELGRYPQAADEARQALAQNPNDSEAMYMLSVAELALGKPADALKTARAGAASDSYHLGLQISIGKALTELERYAEGREAFDRALRLGPVPLTLCVYVDAIVQDPKAAKKTGRDLRAKADSLASAAIDLNPDVARVHIADSKAKMLHGDWKKAETAVRRALSIDANNAHALHLLGLVQQAQGNLRAAGDSYVAAGRSNPQGSAVDNLHSLGKVAAPVGLGAVWVISRIAKASGKGAVSAGAPIAIVLVIVAIVVIALLVYKSQETQTRRSSKPNYSHLSPEAQRIIKQHNDLG